MLYIIIWFDTLVVTAIGAGVIAFAKAYGKERGKQKAKGNITVIRTVTDEHSLERPDGYIEKYKRSIQEQVALPSGNEAVELVRPLPEQAYLE